MHTTANVSTEPLTRAQTDIQLNADWSKRCAIQSHDLPWLASPSPLVQRRLLERDGGEVARATSVVRYAPGARFSAHPHDQGEEIFVLEGTFSDESGHHGPGTYLKNPPGSSHAPYSEAGCTIFVKLRYQDLADTERVVVNTREAGWRPGLVPGLTVLPLHAFGTQHTALVRWAPETFFQPHTHWGGEEIFVIKGVFSDEHGDHPAGTWLRSPHLSRHQPFSRPGCLILVKVGHLLLER
jgi:anti-sigma factor ChrR (cupin superfamily)